MTKNPTDYATPRAVLFDLDSTLFDVSHREHLAPVGPNRSDVDMWIDYSKGCLDDTVVEGVAKVARMLYAAGYLIFIVSGRNIEALYETYEVLRKNDVPFHEVRLHTANDLRHNGEYKSQYINELKVRGVTPELMFEDHVEVCEMIEERTGVPCVTVKPRYKDNIGVSFNLNQYPDLAAN